MLEKTLGDVGEDIRDDGDDIRDDGEDIREVLEDVREDIAGLPCLCLRCWGRHVFDDGSHVFPIFP